AAIIGGTTSGAADDAVVFVAVQRATINDECAATLLAPNLVLTARHCVARYDDRAWGCTQEGTPFGEGGAVFEDLDPKAIAVFVGATRPADATRATPSAVGAQIVHDSATHLCGHDLALVVL